MNKLLKWIILVSVAIMMVGCATHANFVQKYDGWLGKDYRQLMRHIGYADTMYKAPNGNKVYVYSKTRVYSTPSASMMMGPYYYPYYYPYYGGAFGFYGGNDIRTETCKLFIEVNKNQRIVRWQSRGNHCVAKDPVKNTK
ncbi:MAG: hypothetical protein U9Q90_07380 [Campylobacterota bacterium]|nr:hypothetical protein [Campylobacterota bacterium]